MSTLAANPAQASPAAAPAAAVKSPEELAKMMDDAQTWWIDAILGAWEGTRMAYGTKECVEALGEERTSAFARHIANSDSGKKSAASFFEAIHEAKPLGERGAGRAGESLLAQACAQSGLRVEELAPYFDPREKGPDGRTAIEMAIEGRAANTSRAIEALVRREIELHGELAPIRGVSVRRLLGALGEASDELCERVFESVDWSDADGAKGLAKAAGEMAKEAKALHRIAQAASVAGRLGVKTIKNAFEQEASRLAGNLGLSDIRHGDRAQEKRWIESLDWFNAQGFLVDKREERMLVESAAERGIELPFTQARREREALLAAVGLQAKTAAKAAENAAPARSRRL
jgi:hypothetical protein